MTGRADELERIHPPQEKKSRLSSYVTCEQNNLTGAAVIGSSRLEHIVKYTLGLLYQKT